MSTKTKHCSMFQKQNRTLLKFITNKHRINSSLNPFTLNQMKITKDNPENRLPKPTTISQKYGALLGIMTGIIANEEIFHTSKGLDQLIYTFESNIDNDTEQFVLDQAKEYKEGPKTFPFADQSPAPGWALQTQITEEANPVEVSTKIFDLSLPHAEVDLIVDALFYYQSVMEETMTVKHHQSFESIYAKFGIKPEVL